MTNSFFLVHLIDKNNYFGINALYNIPHDLFIKGRSCYRDEIVYIQGIEPQSEVSDFLHGDFGTDGHSLWLGVGIIPKETFEANVGLYNNLCSWIMEFLYLSRFLVNLNLKARVFFHVESFSEENSDSKLSFQRLIEINCDGGSNFQVRYNKYQLLLPLLTKLLEYNPTDKLRAIMYNYATSKKGKSGPIDYFFSFATLEGILQNWTEDNGYSQLWGTSIANSNEQNSLHEDLKAHFEQFVLNQNIEGHKLRQLLSFKDSTFPSNRKIMRSIKQRFKSYYNNRLTGVLRERDDIQTLFNRFHQISSRRNEIGHSLETYARSPIIVEDINTLMSSIKILMDFEINQFLTGEMDWKFEIRLQNLRDNMILFSQDNVLDKFNHNILVQNENGLRLKDRFGVRNIEKAEFQSGMVKQNGDDSLNIIFSQNLKLALPHSFSRRSVSNPATGIVNVYAHPYWLISITTGNSHYILKTFPPSKITSTSNSDVKLCEISSENILSVFKLDFTDIPEDLDIFNNENL